MNIIEAIKSGKRFIRPCFDRRNWMYLPRNSVQIHRIDGVPYDPDVTDILADDWQIEEETIEITRSQLFKAWEKFWSKDRMRGFRPFRELMTNELNWFEKELGFKEGASSRQPIPDGTPRGLMEKK